VRSYRNLTSLFRGPVSRIDEKVITVSRLNQMPLTEGDYLFLRRLLFWRLHFRFQSTMFDSSSSARMSSLGRSGTLSGLASAPATGHPFRPAKPKLTDEQQRGFSFLETAEASAGGLEAPSRIVAYTLIAQIYQKTNRKKAINLVQ